MRTPRFRPGLELLEDRLAPAAYTVNALGDAGNGAGNSGDIRYVITQLNTSNDPTNTITFNVSGGAIVLTSALPAINKNVTITGPNTPLMIGRSNAAGTPNFNIFNINAGITVGISLLTLSNGNAGNGFGGAITNDGSLTLTNVQLSGNTASSGGAIENTGPALTLTNCYLTGNSAATRGGAIESAGDNTNVQITNTTISGNSATKGGGIANVLGTMTISGGTVQNNTAVLGGGGIDNYAQLNIGGGTSISSNTVTGSGDGGGILNDDNPNAFLNFDPNVGGLTLRATISGNFAANGGGIANRASARVVISDTAISGNRSSADGAGIFNAGALDIYSSTLSGNTATGDGGGIRNVAATSLTVHVLDSTLSGNVASNGGAIRNTGTVNLASDTIANNSSSSGSTGGVVNDSGATCNVVNTIIASNFGGNNPDVLGAFASLGTNLIRNGTGSTGFQGPGDLVGTANAPVDPRLNALANNGGPTQTMTLGTGSPALNAGNNARVNALGQVGNLDQRGQPRIAGGTLDIGAVEMQPS